MIRTILLPAIWVVFLLWNLVVFALYALDKRRARKDQWRIPEKTLLLSAFLMGGPGAFLGMRLCRHKTKHLRFRIIVPLSLALSVLVMGLLTRQMLRIV